MIMKNAKAFLYGFVASTLVLFFTGNASAEWKFQNSNVRHSGQAENWSCGPTTISMWASAIWRARGQGYSYVSGNRGVLVPLNSMNISPRDIATQCCGTDGTTIPEFIKGIYHWTPASPPYIFSEWAYDNDKAAVKSIMWTIARFGEPVAVAGGNGMHYVLVRGGRSDYNPHTYWSSANPIRGVYVNDSTENSPIYGSPVSKMYKDREYTPSKLMEYWTRIGGIFDKKYRSIERYGTSNGKTYNDYSWFSNF